MSTLRTIPLLIAVLALTLGGCGGNSRDLAYKNVQIAELEAQNEDLKSRLAAKEARIASLQSELSQARQQHQHDPSREVARELAGSGAEVEWRNGELIISIANEILFRPGSAELTAEAKGSLRQVADMLQRRYAGNYVRIEGHTDSQPIRQSRDKWQDNWHLAGARARSVLHELTERGGLERERVAFAGYADTRPRASNDSAAGMAKNRRVEIIVLPTERP